ncbi:hypothetical protein protein [Bacillus cereus G9241]|nr:hypothetical protein protein [Bacillus cereus G9241]
MEMQLIYEKIIQSAQYAKYLLQIYDVDFHLYQSLYIQELLHQSIQSFLLCTDTYVELVQLF